MSRGAKRWLTITIGIGIAAFLVTARFQGSGQWVRELAVSILYTACIGTFVGEAMKRIWPWSYSLAGWMRWPVRAVAMLAAVAAGTLLAFSIAWWWGLYGGRSFWRSYWFAFQYALFITSTFGVAATVYEYWRHRYEMVEVEKERALKLATEARLASLESRIHPHFLFNTLNSISSLIHSNPDEADAQLQRLCALLRFSLDASETGLVPLERELQIVRDYLDIERTRFGSRLVYEIDADVTLAGTQVPPLSVQTLAENAVKHVVAKRREGGRITVRVAVEGDGRVGIDVRDDGPGVQASQLLAGHGLDLLQKRLHVSFGDRAALRLLASSVRMEVPR